MNSDHPDYNILVSDEPPFKVSQLREWLRGMPDEAPLWFNTGDGRLAPITGIATITTSEGRFGFMTGPLVLFASSLHCTTGVPMQRQMTPLPKVADQFTKGHHETRSVDARSMYPSALSPQHNHVTVTDIAHATHVWGIPIRLKDGRLNPLAFNGVFGKFADGKAHGLTRDVLGLARGEYGTASKDVNQTATIPLGWPHLQRVTSDDGAIVAAVQRLSNGDITIAFLKPPNYHSYRLSGYGHVTYGYALEQAIEANRPRQPRHKTLEEIVTDGPRGKWTAERKNALKSELSRRIARHKTLEEIVTDEPHGEWTAERKNALKIILRDIGDAARLRTLAQLFTKIGCPSASEKIVAKAEGVERSLKQCTYTNPHVGLAHPQWRCHRPARHKGKHRTAMKHGPACTCEEDSEARQCNDAVTLNPDTHGWALANRKTRKAP